VPETRTAGGLKPAKPPISLVIPACSTGFDLFGVRFGYGYKSFPQILVRVADPVEAFGFKIISNRLLPPFLQDVRDRLGKEPDLPGQLDEKPANQFQGVHKRMTGSPTRLRFRLSDLPGLHEQQHDPADEREGSDNRRYKVAVGGLNVHAEEIDRRSRSLEGDPRVSEHHDAESDQNHCNYGFCVHIKSPIYFLRSAAA
jgi:hypothetical protein